METSLRWQIALTMVPGLGPVHAKSLLNSFDIEEVFCANRSELENAGALPQRLLTSLLLFSDWKRVEEEICFIERNRIRPLFITDTDYPSRLLSCPDAPVLIYYRGDAQLNASRTIAVVGTRGCTRHGVRETEEIIAALAPYGATIISGLAMGIDTVAHQTAIEHGLPTLAVLPLGLDAVYPAINRPLARKILRTAGGLLTESMTKNYGDAYLFPRRNRIVAGCSDAIVVVESGKKGGSLITAGLAIDYGREVFAVPGRTTDPKSQGCHALIKQQKAQLIETGDDIAQWMGWTREANAAVPEQKSKKIKALPTTLTASETRLLHYIGSAETRSIDQLNEWNQNEAQALAAALLTLELAGLIVSLPGNRYQTV